MSRLDGFNRIAWLYDSLAAIIFFGNIFKSQTHFLPLIPPQSNVLILGGGSGRILQALFRVNPAVKIWYVEASSSMIRQSIRRVGLNSNIQFIHGTEADVPRDIRFDAVIAPFFFDLFEEPYLSGLVHRLLKVTNINSIWLVTDFVDHAVWHRPFLNLMYRFFNIMCGVAPRKLPDWDKALEANGLNLQQSKSFYAGFISANVYSVVTHT
jgi:tRNA (cmo5U34)-methyltransferase